MPKRRSLEEEQEVIGQIFDFIFKEAKKKPEKRKPIKVSGLNGKGLLTDGLIAALEKPGAFLTTQAAKDLQDSLDITLTKILPNQADPTAPIKISASNLVSIFKDPMGTMQSMKDRADANRKSGKANYLGKVMRQFTASGWARRYADLDTQIAVRLGMASQNISELEKSQLKFKERSDVQGALGQAAAGKGDTYSHELANMQERAATLLGRNTFTEGVWNSFSKEKQDRFRSIFGMGQSVGDADGMTASSVAKRLENELVSLPARERQAIIDRYNRVIKGYAAGDAKSISLADAKFYRNLELGNIKNRINILKSKGNLSPAEQDQVDSLESASLIIRGQDMANKNLFNARSELDKSIKATRDQLRIEPDANRKSELKRKLKGLNADSRELNSMRFWTGVGTWEGRWGSFKNLVIDGNLLPSIYNGDFFDSNKNDFAPSRELKVGGAAFYVPITKFEDKNGDPKSNVFLESWNSGMTQLYYLTPRSMMRTIFFNGEGIAYLSYLQSRQISGQLQKFAKNNLSANLLGNSSLMAGITDEHLKSILGGKSQDVINAILKDSNLNPQSAAYAQLKDKLDKLLGKGSSSAVTQKFFSVFSFNAQLKDKVGKAVEKWLSKRRQKVLDEFMETGLYKKFFSGMAGEALGQWAKKGGLQNIARALVVAAGKFFGFATYGGLANFVINSVTMVVSDALFAVGKILFGMVIFALIGVIGMIIMMTGGQYKQNKQTYAYANTVPGDVYVNPNFTGTSPITGEDDDHQIGDFEAGSLPDGEKCLLGAASYSCTQGPYGSYSHGNVAAVDLTGVDAFYAPAFCGNDNCVVTYSGSAYCTAGYAGGMVKFKATYGGSTYEFTLIHVNTTYGVGTKLSAGQKVARVMTHQETTSACSSGEHLHLQTKVNSSVVNPWEVLTEGSLNGGFSCNIGSCPAN